MRRQIWAPLLMLLFFVTGGLAQRVFFEPPKTDLAMAKVTDDWHMASSGQAWFGSADSTWQGGRPLGSAPAPPPPPAPPLPPPPPTVVPAGIVEVGKNSFQAIFFDPVAGKVVLKRGDPLPSGGRVVRVERNVLEWTNIKGQRFRHVMLSDAAPFTTYASGVAPGGFPVGPPPALPAPVNAKKP